MQQLSIRPATERDHDAIWKIFQAVVSTGDTYAIDPDISREDALAYWFAPKSHTYIAEAGRKILGTYALRTNRASGGSHVSNAGFMVAPAEHGRGIGRTMAEHCLNEARRLGFTAMQFNFVISTNEHAIRLWKNLGFAIVGTLPGAFRHPTKGFVDVYVMFRQL